MKQLLNLSFLLLVAQLNATVYTVSNNPDSPAEYSDLQTALNFIDPGDTIILSGSPVNYGNVTANRSLVLIGPGWNPESGHPAKISNLTINGASHNSYISGIDFGTLTAGGSFEGLTITNSRFNSSYTNISLPDHDNCKIYGNVFSQGYIDLANKSTACMISNNVFDNYTSSGTGILYRAPKGTLLFNNLIFSPHSHVFFSSSAGVFIANNIFVMANSSSSSDPNSGCTGCNYNNNITYSTFGIDVPDIPGPANYGGNNRNNQNPRFELMPNDATGFSTDHDYHLAGNSPGLETGTDGTDLGIYGRSYDFNSSGHTDLPRIYMMNIENPVVLVDSSLNVVVKGTTTK